MIQGITLPEAYDQNKYFNRSIFIYAVFQAGEMFEGEFQSLKEIYGTDTLRVPRPIKVIFLHERDYFLLNFKVSLILRCFFHKSLQLLG